MDEKLSERISDVLSNKSFDLTDKPEVAVDEILDASTSLYSVIKQRIANKSIDQCYDDVCEIAENISSQLAEKLPIVKNHL